MYEFIKELSGYKPSKSSTGVYSQLESPTAGTSGSKSSGERGFLEWLGDTLTIGANITGVGAQYLYENTDKWEDMQKIATSPMSREYIAERKYTGNILERLGQAISPVLSKPDRPRLTIGDLFARGMHEQNVKAAGGRQIKEGVEVEPELPWYDVLVEKLLGGTADVVVDPTNLIPSSAIAKPLTATKKGIQATKTGAKAVDAITELAKATSRTGAVRGLKKAFNVPVRPNFMTNESWNKYLKRVNNYKELSKSGQTKIIEEFKEMANAVPRDIAEDYMLPLLEMADSEVKKFTGLGKTAAADEVAIKLRSKLDDIGKWYQENIGMRLIEEGYVHRSITKEFQDMMKKRLKEVDAKIADPEMAKKLNALRSEIYQFEPDDILRFSETVLGVKIPKQVFRKMYQGEGALNIKTTGSRELFSKNTKEINRFFKNKFGVKLFKENPIQSTFEVAMKQIGDEAKLKLVDDLEADGFLKYVDTKPEKLLPGQKAIKIRKYLKDEAGPMQKELFDNLKKAGGGEVVEKWAIVPEDAAKLIERPSMQDADIMAVKNIFLKALNIFRRLATIVRTGFHGVNFTGGQFNNYVALGPEILKAKPHKITVNYLRGKKHFKPFYTKSGEKITYEVLDDIVKSHNVRSTGFIRADHAAATLDTLDNIWDWQEAGWLKKLFMRVNPFSKEYAMLKVGEKVGALIEDEIRVSHIVEALRQGKNADEAVLSMKASQFDYSDLSDIERKYLRFFVPFYTWQRNNIPFQIKNIVKHPERYSNYFKVQRQLALTESSREERLKPDYMRETGAFKVGADTYLSPKLPIGDIGFFDEPFKNILESANPLIKIPIEYAFGSEIFTGRPTGGVRKFGGVGRGLKLLPNSVKKSLGIGWKKEDGEIVHYIPAGVKSSVLNNLVAINEMNDIAEGLASKKPKDWYRALAAAIGVKFTAKDERTWSMQQKYKKQDDRKETRYKRKYHLGS